MATLAAAAKPALSGRSIRRTSGTRMRSLMRVGSRSGGRRSNLLTILVEPRSADQTFLTRLKRPIERLVAS